MTSNLPPSRLPSRPQNDNDVFCHMPSLTDSEVKGDVLYLGYYQSAFNWDDETAKVTGVWGQNGLGSERAELGLQGRVRFSWCVSRGLVPIKTSCPGTQIAVHPRFLREAGVVLPHFFSSHLLPSARCFLQASKQHRLKRYHSQTYGNGSKCDLNGRPREAEVRVSLPRRKENGPQITVSGRRADLAGGWMSLSGLSEVI